MVNRSLLIAAASLISALLPAGQVQAAEATQNQWKRIDAHTLQFVGDIVPETERDFFLALDDGITTLVVTSTGGQLRPAVNIGLTIADRGLTVRVQGYCLSSCANYFFLAAERKIIAPGGLIGFHGSATSFDLEGELARIDAGARLGGDPYAATYARRNALIDSTHMDRLLEQRLAAAAGFDLHLLRDTSGTVTLDDEAYSFPVAGAQIMWWPSAELMRVCYGVTGITDQARPGDPGLQAYVEDRVPEGLILLGDAFLPACDVAPVR